VRESTNGSRLHGKAGVRFFGDIHGCHAEFAALAEDALDRNLHLHSLGDLINRGPDSPGCMRLACDLHDAGWLDLNPGNHEERFLRWFKGEPVPVKPNGLGSTLAQLKDAPDADALTRRYINLLLRATLWSRFGRVYAVHAALHPEMLGRDGPMFGASDWSSDLHHFALEGEMRPEDDPQRWELGRRSYGWLDEIPAGVTVMIGHSVASTDGLRERRNDAGGRIVHLDTGLQRSGRLSYIDVPMAVIECLDEPKIADFPQVTATEIRATRAAKHAGR
jgi:protein phosphatase